jgi:glycosyltransferase involved in cell wall biosynthesis
MNKCPVLTIVVPCFNEEDVLQESFHQLRNILHRLIRERLVSSASKLLFVDDGSSDNTWPLIEIEHAAFPEVTGLKLSRNVGHQKALFAGLESAKAYSDCVISIDADLQDDVGVIRDFIHRFHEGCEIVYGVRASRETDTWYKRQTAHFFYRFMNRLGIHLIPDHADFRLMSKRALYELCRYGEVNLFLRGIVPLIGFTSAKVYYKRKERTAGKSKYSLKKMISLALDGIASFSIMPVRFIAIGGLSLLILSVAATAFAWVEKWTGNPEPGWTSLMISIWFIGGLQLLGIGVIGEYIGKIYIEVKQRPKFAIDRDLYTPTFARKLKIKAIKQIAVKNGAFTWTK